MRLSPRASFVAREGRQLGTGDPVRWNAAAGDSIARAQLDADLAAILTDALVADFLDDRRRDGRNPEGNQP